ncbi:death-associated protein 1 isoform X2 [Scyliorhinus canicula]|uniref:death-associated protein 1 isoform X2 n=1 Tax=Scyliorhinus canicula TaxID=7830 RepID=UPI0018F7A880|nr:death-associated protein 1 isoform X2 [Scyliorhinus canicula]
MGKKVEVMQSCRYVVKAGGMRIVKKHQGPATQASAVEKDKESEDWESNSPKLTVPIIISGAVARGDKDFPPAAAQVAHQKPYPSVEKLPVAHQINHSIHQPRK